jgi:hypothetical protein
VFERFKREEAEAMRAVRARQREEFRGASSGAVGLLAAVGVTDLNESADGALLGAEHNVLERLDLPALPAGDSELVSGGAAALAIVDVGTLVGGKAGERSHRKVDRAGFLE